LLLLDLPLQEIQEGSFVCRQVLVVQEAIHAIQAGRVVSGSPAVFADSMDHAALRLAEEPVVAASYDAALDHDGTSLFRTCRHLSRLPP